MTMVCPQCKQSMQPSELSLSGTLVSRLSCGLSREELVLQTSSEKTVVMVSGQSLPVWNCPHCHTLVVQKYGVVPFEPTAESRLERVSPLTGKFKIADACGLEPTCSTECDPQPANV
jgi:hypothetical protein